MGRFVIRERLGSGGMGVVYAADDPHLERRIALKVVRRDAQLEAESSARLVAEARAMARLSHPNVITVYEAGTVDGQVFIAMELVEGFTLRTWLEAEPRAASTVVDVLRRAGRGLAAAHEAGIVHRDFKPENVLVSTDGKVSVTDFGLARSFDASDESGVRVRATGGTSTTRFAGTPAYMAPEQLRQHTVDARCDQFAWAVTAFEALTGHRPFDEATLHRITVELDFVPSVPTLSRTLPLPGRVLYAIERGLAFDADARWDALPTLLARLEPRRRTWVPIAVGGTVALAGVAFAAMPSEDPCPPAPALLADAWSPDVRARVRTAFEATQMPYAQSAIRSVERVADAHAERWVELQQQACRTGLPAMRACLERRRQQLRATTALFETADSSVVERSVSMIVAVPSPADCLEPSTAANITEDGSAAQSIPQIDSAEAKMNAGHYDEASEQVADARAGVSQGDAAWFALERLRGRIALARGDTQTATAAFEGMLARADGSAHLPWVADAAVGLLQAQAQVGADFEADLGIARAAEIAVSTAGNPPLLRAKLHAARARILILAGRFDEGLASVAEARSTLEGLGERDRPELGDVLHVGAVLFYEKGQLDQAEALLDQAIELRRSLLGDTHPAVATSLVARGAISLARGDAERATQMMRDAAVLQRNALGSQHPDYARTLSNVGSALKVLGRLEDARAQFREAYAIFEGSVPASDPHRMAARLNLAMVEHDLGDLEAAAEVYEALRRTQREALGDAHPMLAVTLGNLGVLRLEQRRFDEARTHLEASLAIRRAAFGEEHDRTLSARLALAQLELETGEPRQALETATEVRGARERLLGAQHERVIETIMVQAKAALRASQWADAARFSRDAVDMRVAQGAATAFVDAARFVHAQALAGSGEAAKARSTAAKISEDALNAPELRGWCPQGCDALLRALLEGVEKSTRP